MNLTDWSALAELIAAIGVLATLGYLAFQIHQNTRVLKNQSLNTAIERFLRAIDHATNDSSNSEIFRSSEAIC